MAKLTKAQVSARCEILAFIEQRGGRAAWSQLHGRGFHYMTVSSMVVRGLLHCPSAYVYAITPEGRTALTKEKQDG